MVPAWLASTGVVATTVGVLIALYVAVWREPRKARDERAARDEQARDERKRYDDQMAALQRAEDDRIAAQARKVVPSVNRAEMFGDKIWIARVLNTSTGAITNLAVVVAEFDSEGNVVRDSAQPGNNQVNVAGGMQTLISDAMNGAFAGLLSGNPLGQMLSGAGQSRMNPNQMTRALEQQIGPQVRQQMQEAMSGQLMTEWPTTLAPNQPAIMAFQTTLPDGQLRIAIEYEDEAGYRWQRTGNGQPARASDGAPN
jgi:hypothetical protein